MAATLDLGAVHTLDSIQFYTGQIPYPAGASLRMEYALQADGDFQSLGTIENPPYDNWTPSLLLNGKKARYVRLVFESKLSHFNISEVEITGAPSVGGPPPVAPETPGEESVDEGFPAIAHGSLIRNVLATDEFHSTGAARLLDNMEPPGTSDVVSWENTQRWDRKNYPMSAVFDLGGDFNLTQLEYFVGNINRETASVVFEYSTASQGDNFEHLVTVDHGHRYGRWRTVPLASENARRVRIRFDEPHSQFNISELRFHGSGTTAEPVADVSIEVEAWDRTYVPGAPLTFEVSVSNKGPADVSANLGIAAPAALTDVSWACTDNGIAICPVGSGQDLTIDGSSVVLPNSGELRYIVSGVVDSDATGTLELTASATVISSSDPATGNNTATASSSPTDVSVVESDLPRPGRPGKQIVRSFGFGSWPSTHLTGTCRELHDRYWTLGPNVGQSTDPSHPDNLAYHTWHPALTTHPDTGEACDFGHEHGVNPSLAPADVFELSGGWPAFGYAAEVANGARHEDHVGHKITVAHYRASIGNGAGSDPLYDAGFECDWLSKIHQGSYSMDAFANHMHEYFLTLRCFDGLNENGEMDGDTPGTALSVKVVYTWGAPNKFLETDCSNFSVFDADSVKGPDGRRPMAAMQTQPVSPRTNHREFTCIDGIKWKDLTSRVNQVDLWTELIDIKNNSGRTAMKMQPYYIVKNPSRVIAGFDPEKNQPIDQVIRTIDICYRADGSREKYDICDGAPAQKPADWAGWQDPRSPFNGTLRAVNFKSVPLYNADGPGQFCTDAFGRQVSDTPPCERNHILQRVASFNNNWNNSRYSWNGVEGHVSGSIWAEDPRGNRFESPPDGNGGYVPRGIGFEFIIDNRQPDDDNDGVPDGARIRGVN